MNQANWKTIKVEDICRLVRGSSPRPKGDVRYYGGDVPRLMVQDVTRDGHLVTPKIDFLTNAGAKLSRFAPAGTVVMVVSGKVGRVSKLAIDACIHDGFVGFLDLDKKQVDADYFIYCLETFQALNQKNAAGAIWKNLTTTQIKNMKIPLPPMEDQVRIARILDEASALIEKRRIALAKLDDLLQATFLDMFGDPVTNPKGWNRCKLGGLTEIKSGSTPSRQDPLNYENGSINWVKTTEVNGYRISDTEEKITDLGMESARLKLFPINSILIAMYGQGKTRGRCGVLGKESCVNQACAVLLPNNKYRTGYLFSSLTLLYDRLRELGRGGNQPNLNGKLLKSFEISVPPIQFQSEFELILDVHNRNKLMYMNGLKQQGNLFNALQQRAFRGEL